MLLFLSNAPDPGEGKELLPLDPAPWRGRGRKLDLRDSGHDPDFADRGEEERLVQLGQTGEPAGQALAQVGRQSVTDLVTD